MENPGHPRSKERDHVRRPLLFLIGGVPTEGRRQEAGPQDVSLGRGRQEWRGAQPPTLAAESGHFNSGAQVTQLSAPQQPTSCPGLRNHLWVCVSGIPPAPGTSSVLSSRAARDLGDPKDRETVFSAGGAAAPGPARLRADVRNTQALSQPHFRPQPEQVQPRGWERHPHILSNRLSPTQNADLAPPLSARSGITRCRDQSEHVP